MVFDVKTEQIILTLYKPVWQQIKNLPFCYYKLVYIA